MKNSAARKLKQVPAGYLLVGVDPHKKKHAAVAMTQDLMVQSKFNFANSRRVPSIPELSKQARQRLKWFDYYNCHGHNARLTCR